RHSIHTVLLVIATFTLASGQVEKKTSDVVSDQSIAPSPGPVETNKGNSNADEPEIWIHFVGGKRRQVAEATEAADGFWLKIGNVTTFVDRNRVDRIERRSNIKEQSTSEPLRGSGNWKLSNSVKVENFFLSKFGRRLPVAALGQSDLHTRWGYDHRQGMDVGLHPDSVEGRSLIEFLRSEDIPFLAFREAVPGVATGPHIHVGNPSRRLLVP
ncbi:MAG: hypothetical protein WAL47_12155, partial [Pyrinomonadaceae bacterium]